MVGVARRCAWPRLSMSWLLALQVRLRMCMCAHELVEFSCLMCMDVGACTCITLYRSPVWQPCGAGSAPWAEVAIHLRGSHAELAVPPGPKLPFTCVAAMQSWQWPLGRSCHSPAWQPCRAGSSPWAEAAIHLHGSHAERWEGWMCLSHGSLGKADKELEPVGWPTYKRDCLGCPQLA